MKKKLYVLALCTLCLTTHNQAMRLSQASSSSSVKNPIKKLTTPQDYASLQEEINQKWSPIKEKRLTIAQAHHEKKIELDNRPLTPLFGQPQKASAPSLEDTLQKERYYALQKEIENKWLPIEKKLQSILLDEQAKLRQKRAGILPTFRSSLQKLPPLFSDDNVTETIQELSKSLVQDKAEQTTPEDSSTALETGVTLATASACVLALQQHTTDQTRTPFALIGAGLSLLDSSKKAITTTAGLYFVYRGIKSAVNSFNEWYHSDCEREKESLAHTYLQKLTELEQKIDAREAALTQEVTRISEQARENAFDTLLRQDKLEKSINPRMKDFEINQKRTDSRVIETKEDLEKMRKQLFKEIERVRRHKDDEVQRKLNSFKKQLESVQDKAKSFSKGDQTIANNEAFAILSLELQRLSEDMRQLAPHSRRSSLAPSEAGSYTSRAPSEQDSRPASPTASVYSTRSEIVPRPRPVSAISVKKHIEEFLNDISEEHTSEKHSSPENSERGDIRILPPTPPKQEITNTHDQASSSYQQPETPSQQAVATLPTQKPASPHRRKSICFGIFKKDPKDAHDPRE